MIYKVSEVLSRLVSADVTFVEKPRLYARAVHREQDTVGPLRDVKNELFKLFEHIYEAKDEGSRMRKTAERLGTAIRDYGHGEARSVLAKLLQHAGHH